jgi:hypothetical protein
MATVTLALAAEGPGKGAVRPGLFYGSRTRKVGNYTITFSGNYVSGGENIAPIWNDFTEVSWIQATCRGSTVADMRYAQVDHANKKLILYTAGATEQTVASITGVSFDLQVVGY